MAAGTYSRQGLQSNWITNGYLVKLNKDGEILWEKTYSGEGNDIFISLLEVSDGYLILGVTTSFSDNNSEDILLIKVDKNGTELWKKTYGGKNRDQGNELLLLSDNNFIIAGLTESKGAGSSDAYIIKINPLGDIIWEYTYGGTEFDDAWDIVETNDGSMMFTGGTYSYSNGTLDDGWIVKISSDGEELWKKTYGYADQEDWFWSIENAGNNEFVLVGLLNNNPNDPRVKGMHFIKVDSKGDLIWDKSFGQGRGYEGNDIKKDKDGGYIIGGRRLGQSKIEFLFVKTNEQGDTLWTKGYGEDFTLNRVYGVNLTSDGNYIATGLANQTPTQNSDILIVKLKNTLVSIENEELTTSFSIFPNPVEDILQINKTFFTSNNTFRISNLNGEIILEFKSNHFSDGVDISNFQKGTYFLSKISSKGKEETIKFIKK